MSLSVLYVCESTTAAYPSTERRRTDDGNKIIVNESMRRVSPVHLMISLLHILSTVLSKRKHASYTFMAACDTM